MAAGPVVRRRRDRVKTLVEINTFTFTQGNGAAAHAEVDLLLFWERRALRPALEIHAAAKERRRWRC